MIALLVSKGVIGNIYSDKSLYEKSRGFQSERRLEKVVLSSRDRKKTRMKKTTDHGTEIGIVTPRGAGLSSGDVLILEKGRMILVELELEEVLVIDFKGDFILERAVKLGHLLGNQHWPIMVKDESVYIPITLDKSVMETVIRGSNIEGITIRYEKINPSDFEAPPQHHHKGVKDG